MERIDTILKGIIASIGGIISYLVGGFGIIPVLLASFMVIDFITGIMASKYVGKPVKSDIGIRGLFRKAYILLLLWCVYRIEGISLEFLGFDMSGFTGDAIAIMFLVMELVSILENGSKMGAKLPIPFQLFIEKTNKLLNGDHNDTNSQKPL